MFKNRIGQSGIEFLIVAGLVVIPTLTAGLIWIKTEWNKSECAFQTFKRARIEMIRTQQAASQNGVTVVPLEDLDQNKGGLAVDDLLREVSQLWEQL